MDQAERLAVENDRNDTYSIYRLLDMEFDTLKPVKTRNPKKWLWMAVHEVAMMSQRPASEILANIGKITEKMHCKRRQALAN
ncbi:hypothetical protein ACO0LB_17020 [Undibacterium sp. SXout7W]|uniref:hypothetical protein n=1 Tax=Undibacterium sp. SXout7W TaxID=3413049 RepID=UPI003BF33A9C